MGRYVRYGEMEYDLKKIVKHVGLFLLIIISGNIIVWFWSGNFESSSNYVILMVTWVIWEALLMLSDSEIKLTKLTYKVRNDDDVV